MKLVAIITWSQLGKHRECASWDGTSAPALTLWRHLRPPCALYLVPCSHLVQAPVFPLIISTSFALSDTRACAIILMLFFSAKNFPANKMVLGLGKRLLGFVPSHRDSLLSTPLRFFCLETKLCSTRVCWPDQDQANQDPPELLPLYQVVPCRKILVLV